jgi:hypothetical protein
LLSLAAILGFVAVVTHAEDLPTTGASVVHWTENEPVMQLEQEVPFYPEKEAGTFTRTDAGFHHETLLPNEEQEQAEIRYEPDEVKPEAGWDAVLNMETEENDSSEPLPAFDVEWDTELHGTCDCWNTTEDGRDVEVECRCGGLELTDIPSNLASDVHRM